MNEKVNILKTQLQGIEKKILNLQRLQFELVQKIEKLEHQERNPELYQKKEDRNSEN